MTPPRQNMLQPKDSLKPTVSLSWFVFIVAVCGPVACFGQASNGRISIGGLERLKADSWGLLKGQYENKSDEDQSVTSVVTQQSSSGNQYARTTILPPKTICIVQWPIFVEATGDDAFEFDCMNVVDENGRETINRRGHDQMVESFVVGGQSESAGPVAGYCLSLISDTLPESEIVDLERLCTGLRKTALLPPRVATRSARPINGSSEFLGPVDQLVIACEDLHRSPETCEAIRFWIERGGRALLMMNLMGPDSTRALLGDTLPFTVVDETSPQTLPMTHHYQDSGVRQQADRSYERSMSEPVELTRAVFESGKVIWSIDDWPVLLKIPFGNGTVFVSTISPRVFMENEVGNDLAASATEFLDELFRGQQEAPLLSAATLATAAHRKIGYSIPSRTFPVVVLSLFVVVLGLVGWRLFTAERQDWLIVAAPLIAMLAAIPGLAMGLAARTAVPPTLLETRLINAPLGQTALVADGITTIYQPESEQMNLSLTDSATVISQQKTESGTAGRHVWDRPDGFTWKNFKQPAGVTDYRQRSVVRLPEPLVATGHLDSEGLQVNLANAEFLQPEDPIIASHSPEKMVARSVGGETFRSRVSDLLAPGELTNETMITEEQVERKKLYGELFNNGDRINPFPANTSLIFWTRQLGTSIAVDSEFRRETSTLVVAPVQLSPPEVGQTITIPPTLLPYYSIPDETGAVGAVFTNRTRQWLKRPGAGHALLQFRLPQPCQPFVFESAELQVRINAGSRTMTLSAGRVGEFKEVAVHNSPVGNFKIDLPIDVLNTAGGESVFIKVQVGDVEFEKGDEDSMSANQESYWKIERVLLTIRGQRTSSPESRDNKTQ